MENQEIDKCSPTEPTTYITVDILNEREYSSLCREVNTLVLGAIVHGDISKIDTQWPIICASLPTLGAPFVEVFMTNKTPRYLTHNSVHLSVTDNLIFGCASSQCENTFEISHSTYTNILDTITKFSLPYIYRMWNEIPHINEGEQNEENYKQFCSGRAKAFSDICTPDFNYPAASAVGTMSKNLNVYFLCGASPSTKIENVRQVSAFNYPRQYGKDSPSFARAQIIKTIGGARLFVSGTASILGHRSMHVDNIKKQVFETLDNINALQETAGYKSNFDFTKDDLHKTYKVYIRNKEDYSTVKNILESVIRTQNSINYVLADICRKELLVEIEVQIEGTERTEQPVTPTTPTYQIIDDKIQTRSLEVHITDHCNLKCAECCSLSPLLPERFVDPKDMQRDLKLVTSAISPIYIKIVGGEPLLHPNIIECLKLAKPMAKILSVTTNAVLLERMTDEFWELIDAITISIYPNPKLKRVEKYIEDKGREFGVSLNIKYQSSFVTMSEWGGHSYKNKTQEVFSSCWLRERCHIVDRGRFYMCTRPPHLHTLFKDRQDYNQDGIKLHRKSSLRDEIYQYLTRTTPLKSCSICNGGSAEEKPHRMMTKSEIIQTLELKV
jgi:cyclic pyranopterin phosphate synthase